MYRRNRLRRRLHRHRLSEMRTVRKYLTLPATLILLGACTSMPTGPAVLVLPGTGKSFQQFRADDALCRQFALQGIGGKEPGQVADDAGVRSAVAGAAIGAAAGAAIGGSEGAGVGAGTGLLVGGLAGTEAAQVSGYDAQQRYDFGYIQCMYAQGHRVPVSGRFTVERSQPSGSSTRPRSGSVPPPPPGEPPPPPPDVLPR